MINIDGSLGEGGGQVLRSALTLSILTRQPMRITNIRAGRSKPGLRAQHLASVMAATKICNASVEGASLSSQSLAFSPGEIRPGRYKFDIGTAGSTSLVLQTILLPLGFAAGTSTVSLTGGTHVPWSPCFHYLDLHWLFYLHQMGFDASLKIQRAGFFPKGGGQIQAIIRPVRALKPLKLNERGDLQNIQGVSAVANLDLSIATRQKHQALRRLQPGCRNTKIKSLELPALSPGTFLLLLARYERSQCCYFALGERGKRAERVADEAVDALETFLETGASVDQYLADQLLLPTAFATGPSNISTSKITQHLLTNVEVIRLFLPVRIQIHGEIGEPGWVHISPTDNKKT